MSTAAIASDLVALCREGKNLDVIEKYYADDVVSVESANIPGMGQETRGLEAVKGKNQWWLDNHEVHGETINGPFVGENQFAVEFILEATHKPTGERMNMREIGLYTVKEGKISHEHFYYNAGK